MSQTDIVPLVLAALAQMKPMKKRVTFTLESELIEQLKKKSDETMIPQARIVEQAIKEYLEKMK